jgi:hypothetical protein
MGVLADASGERPPPCRLQQTPAVAGLDGAAHVGKRAAAHAEQRPLGERALAIAANEPVAGGVRPLRRE